MPQRSYGFAVGQVRVLERTLLTKDALDRLVAAGSVEDAAQMLAEFGWGEAHTQADLEQLAARHVQDACELVAASSPEPDTTDCFLLKYDTLNLKVLLKSRVLGIEPEGLSPCGTLDAQMLERAVSENNYTNLPPTLKAVMAQIEKRIAVQMDPLYVDAQLDKAMFQMIFDKLKRSKNEPVLRYFAHKAELTNLLIALRCARMGRGSAMAKDLLVPGGELPLDALARVADEPERAIHVTYMRPYSALVRDALSQDGGQGSLAQLEKRVDDYLLSIIRPHRYEAQTVMPLVGYLLAREREAAAIRLIAIAKRARVPGDKLSDRLRELYA